jgi:WD40 repeat protein
VHLWDATTGTLIARLAPEQTGVSARAVFHPDGHTVVIATSDVAVYRWDTSVEAAIDAACAAAERNIAANERRLAFPERPHRQTSPPN